MLSLSKHSESFFSNLLEDETRSLRMLTAAEFGRIFVALSSDCAALSSG